MSARAGEGLERLLAAAAAVVERQGPHALTLDAVAREAGFSKGGVLYHFPTKRRLLQTFVERWLDDFEAQVERAAGLGPGAWTRAYLLACESDASGAAHLPVLAAYAAETGVLEIVRERYARWQARLLDDGLEPELATLVRLAADGLWLADLLGLAPPDAELRRDVVKRLTALSETASAAATDDSRSSG